MTAPLVCAALLAIGQTGDPGLGGASLVEKEEAAFKAVADAVAPGVVRIETLGGVDTADGRLLGAGPATGTVVRADGLILTSSETFAGDPTSILVRLADGRRLAAERLGEDEARQLTLLRVDADDLTPVIPADPAAVRVGDWAVALGRTFAAERVNLSVGVVSAKDRILGRAVQTDAKISPANYGGPLVDLTGRAIGVLAPLSADGGQGGVEWYDSGIGFAVPLDDLLPRLDDLAAGETLRPGKLGVTFKGANLDAEPVIDSVRAQSPAEAAGLKSGDRLVTVAGRPISRPDSAKLALGPLYAGDEVAMTVERDGERLELRATLTADLPPWRPAALGVLPAAPAADESGEDEPPAVAGARIAHVFPGTPADGVLAPGDIVTAAGGEAVETANDLRRIVSRRTPGTVIELTLDGGDPVTVTLGEPPSAPPEELPEFADEAADPLPADQSGRLELNVAGFEGRGGTLLVPSNPSRRGFGLLVCVPSKAGGTAEQLFGRLGPAAERHGIVLLAPRVDPTAGFGPTDLPFLNAAVEQTVGRYGVDPARAAVFARGAVGWGVVAAKAGTYRGLVTDAVPARLPENEPDTAILPLLLGEPSPEDAERLSDGGYPFAVLPAAADEPLPTVEAAAAIVRWAAALDRM